MGDRKTLIYRICSVALKCFLFLILFTSHVFGLVLVTSEEGLVFQMTKLVNNTVININGSYMKMFEDGEEKDYPPVKTAVLIINGGPVLVTGLMMCCIPVIRCAERVEYNAESRGGLWNIVDRALTFFLEFQIILLVFCVFIKPSSCIIFVEVIGSDVGFTWSDLTPMFLVCFACDIATAVALLCAIVIYMPKYKDKICTGTKTRVRKYHECKMQTQSTNSIFISAHYNELDQEGKCDANIYLQDIHVLDETETWTSQEQIANLVEQLWDQALVGIGRDATNIAHSGIKIINIQRLHNDNQLMLYNQRKKRIVEFANTVGGKLKSPEEYKEGVKPVATAALVRQSSVLKLNIDSDLNEVYLFHGTTYANVTSIEQNGFRIDGGMLGHGIYFTDHPVKADQHTKPDDGKDKCCIVLSRVLLGDTVIQTQTPLISQGDGIRPPCKSCYNVDTEDVRRKYKPFDSLLYDTGLFREYVVYESCLAYPEYAIEYIRQNNRQICFL